MIASITAGSTNGYLYIDGGTSSLPYVSSNANNPMQGMMRLNNSNIEVFNGSSWQMVNSGYATVSLSQTAINTLDWARKKMDEESRIRELAKDNVTIADAWEQYQLAEEKLKVVLTLTDEKA